MTQVYTANKKVTWDLKLLHLPSNCNLIRMVSERPVANIAQLSRGVVSSFPNPGRSGQFHSDNTTHLCSFLMEISQLFSVSVYPSFPMNLCFSQKPEALLRKFTEDLFWYLSDHLKGLFMLAGWDSEFCGTLKWWFVLGIWSLVESLVDSPDRHFISFFFMKEMLPQNFILSVVSHLGYFLINKIIGMCP